MFRKAAPIAGGREERDDTGRLEERSRESGINNFQGRYAIRHPWTGAMNCMSPRRGIWGGPPGGERPADQAATNIAFAPRGNVELPKLVAQDVPEIGLKHQKQGCGCASGSGPSGTVLAGLGMLALVLGRRRRSPR